ncbi:DUF1934 domain-containing protein [Polycladomyces subterraneus]|uniref:DUF1934 domain-containing protein n=1 Tax=Polycladomyces subterraneus TaxID=1016997 RepID=A0ABT8IIL5_9BACL|nr:DUF1934 domain-containing protein [Polycladomyces subterraneus]MDN4592597.1 DUF1934 domain-containing protein [Polycladomyces subterraneus]
MIPVHLHIRSAIQSKNEWDDAIEQNEVGEFEDRDGQWVLRYWENKGTAEEVRTVVKAGENEVTVIRQGAIAYRQTYRPGHETGSLIHTPAGESEMRVRTLDYRRDRRENGGVIFFSFRLHMGEEEMGQYQLQIEWTEGTERP